MNWPEITSLITAATAIGALVFTALSLQDSREQLGLAAQGQFTDRYSRAVEQLGQQGPEGLQIRLGGIYALERLARDSPRDQPTIIEVLTSFIRTNTPAQPREIRRCPPGPAAPAPDIQAAITVLGRRDARHDGGARLFLRSTCLSGADLRGAELSGADLSGADLTNVSLVGAKLADAGLARADLKDAYLADANLTNASLTYANLTSAGLARADLTNASLLGANLADAYLMDAQLSGADLNSADLTNANLNSANLTNTNLTNTNLTHADLSGAFLTGSTHDRRARPRSVTTDADTRGEWW
ncbi:hypothetical protein BU204_37730 [Actinophytocola xanthii]|uniref:Low-complexity protein n=1 Tax=Actinophytocola xanthii TaxID=1912961 RepID=A0A1Q8BQP6_9PSEU|nr:hypothetical protein BU204_37730 [Actinophytocola xanthii]